MQQTTETHGQQDEPKISTLEFGMRSRRYFSCRQTKRHRKDRQLQQANDVVFRTPSAQHVRLPALGILKIYCRVDSCGPGHACPNAQAEVGMSDFKALSFSDLNDEPGLEVEQPASNFNCRTRGVGLIVVCRMKCNVLWVLKEPVSEYPI